jgi:hypothetical protein
MEPKKTLLDIRVEVMNSKHNNKSNVPRHEQLRLIEEFLKGGKK